jgi:hypothetical protein
VRLQAAEMFAHDVDARQIASSLRVSTKSVCQQAIVRGRLRTIQRRPDLINAFLGQTGLTLGPPPP